MSIYTITYKGKTYYLPELAKHGTYAKLKFYLFYVLMGQHHLYSDKP